MKKRAKQPRVPHVTKDVTQSWPSSKIFVIVGFAALLAGGVLAFGWYWSNNWPVGVFGRPATFNRDIAPILFAHCAACHRPGQTAPFSLLTYEEVKKRAKQIVTVVETRYMPPWLPEPGHGEFAGNRRLTTDQIRIIRRWVKEGCAEGAASDLPQAPVWKDEWFLGQPDLIVKMPQPYSLEPDGPDLYRNFVVAADIKTTRYVQAVEFRPGNARIVHHAFIKVDRSGESRRLDDEDAQPGFSYMLTPSGAQIPEGQFLSWNPGRVPVKEADGLSWALHPGSDIVLQLHLRRTGRRERLQAEIGFYFTERAPTRTPFKILLTSRAIDIPAGATDYVVNDSLRLPCAVDVLAVLPHAHYLGRELRSFATLPDGTQRSLLWIKQWDFNWQSDYRYVEPIHLPKDSTVSMRVVYDNSTANVRNPHHPPRRVTYGTETTDEMAELWFRILPRQPEDLPLLIRTFQNHMMGVIRGQHQLTLQMNPNDARAHSGLGQVLLGLDQHAQASWHLRRAIELKPDFDEPHFYLGYLWRRQRKLPEAEFEYRRVIQLSPTNHEAHGNLGLVLLEQAKYREAEEALQAALSLNPQDDVARRNLEALRRAKGGSSPR